MSIHHVIQPRHIQEPVSVDSGRGFGVHLASGVMPL